MFTANPAGALLQRVTVKFPIHPPIFKSSHFHIFKLIAYIVVINLIKI